VAQSAPSSSAQLAGLALAGDLTGLYVALGSIYVADERDSRLAYCVRDVPLAAGRRRCGESRGGRRARRYGRDVANAKRHLAEAYRRNYPWTVSGTHSILAKLIARCAPADRAIVEGQFAKRPAGLDTDDDDDDDAE